MPTLLAPLTFPPARVTTLDSGLTVIHQQVSVTSVTTVDVWVKAGAIVEPDEWSGMAHFLEHMIFKGTEQIPPGYFDWEIERRGGMANAATSQDYAHFFMTTSTQQMRETLPYLAELLLNAAIPEEEFGRERDVVLAEMRQAHDNPDWVAFQVLGQMVYQCHPYGRPILGTEETLRQQTPTSMRQFHRTHYQPENMTVVVVGGLSWDEAIALISQAFQTFPQRSHCPRCVAEAEPPMTEIRRQEISLPRLEQSRLMMAWLGPGLDSPVQELDQQLQAAYGLDILSVLLAEGRSSRLIRELREERHLVQAIGSSFSLQRESGLFTITAWLEQGKIEQVEAIICDRLSELSTTPVSEAELARCKRLLCNDYAFSTESPSQLAGLYGYYNALAKSEIAASYPQRIQAIQLQDLQRLAIQYLSPYRYATVIAKPA